MYSTFLGLEIARRGMTAGRTGMDITGHNVANANTPGYTRQRAEQVAEQPYTIPSLGRPAIAGQMGAGVTVEQIKRIRDVFLDGQIRVETNSLGAWEAQNDALSEIETIFMEPSENGLNTLFSNFWASWQELSKNAENNPLRTNLVQNAVSLASGLNHTYSQLETVRSNLNQLLQIDINDINTKAQQIANLNVQIVNIRAVGDQPNDLMDKRDLLLDELSKLTNFTVTDLGNGSISIDIGTFNLVDGATQTVTSLPDPPNWADVTNGALYGINTVLTKLQSYEDALDTLSNTLITNVNALHTAGFDLTGAPGANFFNGTGAAGIVVNPVIEANVNMVAAGLNAGVAGDGSNALAIAQLQNTSIAALGNTTFDNYYKNLIATLGINAQESARMVESQQALVDQLTNRKESISGVSMDEEMTNLIQYQYAYQAAARVVSVLDSLLDTLINRMAV